MLKCFKRTNDKVAEIGTDEITNNCWIDCVEPTDAELKKLSKVADIPLDDLKLCLDEEERPRIEYGRDYCLLIYRAPFVKKEEDEVEILTSPLGIFLKKNFVVTVHIHHTKYLEEIVDKGARGETQVLWSSPTSFLLKALWAITVRYSKTLKRIEDDMERVEEEVPNPLKKSNKDIMELKKTLMFFHRSLIANRAALMNIIEKKNLYIDKKHMEGFSDLNTETLQLIEMSLTYRDVLSGVQDFQRSMTAGSTNIWIKILTLLIAAFFIAAIIAIFKIF